MPVDEDFTKEDASALVKALEDQEEVFKTPAMRMSMGIHGESTYNVDEINTWLGALPSYVERLEKNPVGNYIWEKLSHSNYDRDAVYDNISGGEDSNEVPRNAFDRT